MFFVRSDGIIKNTFSISFPDRLPGGRAALHIFRVRGRAIGKGIEFPDICIKNGVNFHNFGKRKGTDFQDFGIKYKIGYTFFEKLGQGWVYFFQKIVIRNGYVFEARPLVRSMARPRPKSGQVHSRVPFILRALLEAGNMRLYVSIAMSSDFNLWLDFIFRRNLLMSYGHLEPFAGLQEFETF